MSSILLNYPTFEDFVFTIFHIEKFKLFIKMVFFSKFQATISGALQMTIWSTTKDQPLENNPQTNPTFPNLYLPQRLLAGLQISPPGGAVVAVNPEVKPLPVRPPESTPMPLCLRLGLLRRPQGHAIAPHSHWGPLIPIWSLNSIGKSQRPSFQPKPETEISSRKLTLASVLGVSPAKKYPNQVPFPREQSRYT